MDAQQKIVYNLIFEYSCFSSVENFTCKSTNIKLFKNINRYFSSAFVFVLYYFNYFLLFFYYLRITYFQTWWLDRESNPVPFDHESHTIIDHVTKPPKYIAQLGVSHSECCQFEIFVSFKSLRAHIRTQQATQYCPTIMLSKGVATAMIVKT